jgi:hypothetical protein
MVSRESGNDYITSEQKKRQKITGMRATDWKPSMTGRILDQHY